MKLKFQLCLLGVCLLLSGCTNTPSGSSAVDLGQALPMLEREAVSAQFETCSNLIEGQIAAWQSGEVEELADIYTDDIVHFDGEPAFTGIDEVTQMAENMWAYFPKWQMKAGETFISKDQCLGEWLNWDIFAFKEDEPALEYDLIEYENGQISFWRLFYDQKFHSVLNAPDQVNDALLEQFTRTWSEASEAEIRSLYHPEGMITDTLFAVSASGGEAISDHIAAFLNQFPGAEWRLYQPFAEGSAGFLFKEEYPFPSQGGVFGMTIADELGSICEIQTVLILTPDEEGKITRQEAFYEGNSLVECGMTK